jgi:O-antigen ligase
MWILLFLIMIMPFEQNPHLLLAESFLGVFPRFTLIKLVGLIGLAWSMVRLSSGDIPPAVFTSAQALAFVGFVAVIGSGGLISGAGIVPLTRFVAIIGLLPLVIAAVRRERDLRLVVMTTALVMVAVFPYAVRQMWRFGGRLGVGLYEANYYALILVLLLPLPLVLAREARGARRLLWLGAAGVIVLQLILTGSRGGFLGLLAVGAMLAFRLWRNPILALAGGGVGLLILLLVVPNPLTHRLLASGLSDQARDSGVEMSNRQRMAVIKGGLRMVAAHPLTGVGMGSFKAELPKYVDIEHSKVAHNTYLELAAELGLPALGAFGVVVIAALRSLGRSARSASKAGRRLLRELALGLQAGLVGYLVGATFLSAQYEKFFWLVMFLTIPVEAIARRRARLASRRSVEAAA